MALAIMHEWRASCLFWDVHPIIYRYLPQTTEKVLPPPRKLWRNCYVQSIESASATCKCCSHDTDAQQLWFCEPQFFFGFQPKAMRAGDEKKKAHGLMKWECCWAKSQPCVTNLKSQRGLRSLSLGLQTRSRSCYCFELRGFVSANGNWRSTMHMLRLQRFEHDATAENSNAVIRDISGLG